MSDSLGLHGLQHPRLPSPSPTPRACSNSCPSNRWCHLTISFSVVPFSSCLQSFPASRSFPMSQFFASGGQNIGASASVLSMNIQDWSPLGWTGWISLQSKGLSRVFSKTTVQKHQFCLLPRCSQESKMGHQQLHWSHLRKFGQGARSCRVCSNQHGLNRKYGLNSAASVSASMRRTSASLSWTNWLP